MMKIKKKKDIILLLSQDLCWEKNKQLLLKKINHNLLDWQILYSEHIKSLHCGSLTKPFFQVEIYFDGLCLYVFQFPHGCIYNL